MRARFILILIVVAFSGPMASARSLMSQYHGKVLILGKRPPKKARGKTLGRFIKKHRKSRILSPVRAAEEDYYWPLHLIAFLGKRAGSGDIDLHFFDVNQGQARVSSQSVYLRDPKERQIYLFVKVSEDDGFIPGHQYKVVVTGMRGKRLAETVIRLDALPKHYPKEVIISD